VDKESDTLYFRLDENQVVEAEQVRPGMILDFDENDRVVGVEFLGISPRATREALSVMQFLTIRGHPSPRHVVNLRFASGAPSLLQSSKTTTEDEHAIPQRRPVVREPAGE
jgi:uncharacterized protein YuzE